MSDSTDQGWLSTTLGAIADPHDGLKTGPFGSQLHASDYSEQGIPVIMPKDMMNGRVSDETIARIPIEKAVSLRRHRCKVGDILFGRRGDIGRCGLITEKEQGWLCGTGCLRFRPQKTVSSEFLVYLLGLPETIEWLNSNAVGQTMLNLNTSILAALPLQLPPLAEQRKIAKILSTWDRAIDLTTQLIAAKQQRKRGLMQQLLTGRWRFTEFAGEEWQEVHLGDIFSERVETGRANLPLLSITNKGGIVRRDTIERRDTSTADKTKYLRICKGDLGYNTMRMWQGVSGVSELEGIVSPAYTICVPKPGIDVYFMSYLFKFRPMVFTFWRYSQGLVDDTLSLKFDAFSKIGVRIPSVDEQRRITAVLQACDQEIALLEQKRDLLQQQKQGLMQQLLTGRVRVTTPMPLDSRFDLH